MKVYINIDPQDFGKAEAYVDHSNSSLCISCTDALRKWLASDTEPVAVMTAVDPVPVPESELDPEPEGATDASDDEPDPVATAFALST